MESTFNSLKEKYNELSEEHKTYVKYGGIGILTLIILKVLFGKKKGRRDDDDE